MTFDVAARDPGVIFEPPARGVEGVVNCDHDVLVRLMFRWIATDHDLMLRHSQIDCHMIDVTLSMAPRARFDDNPAGDNTIEKMLELGETLTDTSFDRWRRCHLAKRDLNRHLHVGSPVGSVR